MIDRTGVVVADHGQGLRVAALFTGDARQIGRGQIDHIALAQAAGALHEHQVVPGAYLSIGDAQPLGKLRRVAAGQQRLDALGCQLDGRQHVQRLRQVEDLLDEDHVFVVRLAGLQHRVGVDRFHVADAEAIVAHPQTQADHHGGLAGVGFGG